jgi:hypothetical protein
LAPADEAELTGRPEFEGIRFGGGIARDAEDAVLNTADGCLIPDVVDVGLRDIVDMDIRIWVERKAVALVVYALIWVKGGVFKGVCRASGYLRSWNLNLMPRLEETTGVLVLTFHTDKHDTEN